MRKLLEALQSRNAKRIAEVIDEINKNIPEDKLLREDKELISRANDLIAKLNQKTSSIYYNFIVILDIS